MNKNAVLLVTILIAILLSGCSGDVASPTHNEYDSHAVTTTTTTTETQEMPQTLTGNDPQCKGFFIINSCNTTQTGTQTAGSQSKADTVAAQPPPAKETNRIEEVCGSFLVAAGIIFWFIVALPGLKKLFPTRNEYLGG